MIRSIAAAAAQVNSAGGSVDCGRANPQLTLQANGDAGDGRQALALDQPHNRAEPDGEERADVQEEQDLAGQVEEIVQRMSRRGVTRGTRSRPQVEARPRSGRPIRWAGNSGDERRPGRVPVDTGTASVPAGLDQAALTSIALGVAACGAGTLTSSMPFAYFASTRPASTASGRAKFRWNAPYATSRMK